MVITTIAEGLGRFQKVRAQHDGDPLASEVNKQASQLALPCGIQPDHWLVEGEYWCLSKDGGGDEELLSHPLGKRFTELVALWPQVQPFQQLIGPLPPRGVQAAAARDEYEMLKDGKHGIDIGRFRDEADPASALLAENMPVEHDLALAWAQQSRQTQQGRALPGTVGSKKAEHLARVHAEREMIDRGHPTKTLGQAGD